MAATSRAVVRSASPKATVRIAAVPAATAVCRGDLPPGGDGGGSGQSGEHGDDERDQWASCAEDAEDRQAGDSCGAGHGERE